jgi:hypothetical protein
MSTKWVSFRDIEMGLKKKLYTVQNDAEGCAVVWDAKTRQYVGHIDIKKAKKENVNVEKLLMDYCGYGKGEWGGKGW